MTRDTDNFFSDPFEGLHSKKTSSTSSFSRQKNSSSTNDDGFGFPRGFFDDLDRADDRDLNSNSRHSTSKTSSSTSSRRNLVDDYNNDNRGENTGGEILGGKLYTKTVTIGPEVRPEDVKITLKDFVMTVEVKTEKKGEDGTSASLGFLSKFTIPRNVDKAKITSTWTSEGNLKIEAPLLIAEEEKQQQPIQQHHRNFFDTDSSSSSTSDFFGSSSSSVQNQKKNDNAAASDLTTTPEKYSVSVPVGRNIDPENLKVSIKDDILTIEAKVEKKSENSTSHQEFKRKFTLPPNVDSKGLTSTLSDGCLKIEAPVMTPKRRQ